MLGSDDAGRRGHPGWPTRSSRAASAVHVPKSSASMGRARGPQPVALGRLAAISGTRPPTSTSVGSSLATGSW